MSRPVLVTGATGFIGVWLCRELIGHGYRVHALVRAGSDRARLDGLDVRFARGDLGDAASLVAAVAELGEGAAVIHGAARISYRTRDGEAQWEANVEGTRRVLEACRAARVARLVHVSSVVAVGHARGRDHALDEDAPYNGDELRCDYATTKRAAEELVLAAAEELDVVVANPGAVFGPGSEASNTTAFLQRVERGTLGPFAPPGSLAVVGVEDVATGLRLVLERGRRGARYVLSESNVELAELLARAGAALGRRPPRFVVPLPAWRAVVAAAGAWDRLFPAELATPQSLRLLGTHFRFDAARAREELGWAPRPFDEVLAETVGWMRARGLVSRHAN